VVGDATEGVDVEVEGYGVNGMYDGGAFSASSVGSSGVLGDGSSSIC
jgi:hypothetical protein